MPASAPNTKEINWLSQLELARLKQELGSKPQLSSVARAMRSHFTKVDEALCASDNREGCQPACKKHCSHCCHTIVYANFAEIAAAYIHLSERLTKAQMEELKSTLQASSHHLIKAYNAKEPQTITCPFLKDGACSIYEARPSQCRNTHSLNDYRCRQAYDEPSNTERIIPVVPERQEISRLMLSAVASALHSAKLDHNLYEFSTGLLSVIESPAVLQRWLKGRKIPTTQA